MNQKISSFSLIVIFLLSVFIISSCQKDPILGDVVIDNELREYLYSNSTDTLTIENQKLVINTELYRDFFPGGPPPSSRPLIASIDMVNIDSIQIQSNLDIIKLYVINNEEMWISTPTSCDNCYLPDFVLRKTSTDGPEWETNIYVDVVVEITNFDTSIKYYLMTKDQLIYKVE